jgi:1,4-alpha-glucan branching enzyme
MDAAIYNDMTIANISIEAMRGVALHKLARLATLATSGGGYLNFIGNEFGHPEWIDFPREGNHFSYQYARRQWSLRDNPDLLFAKLADFDQALLKLFTETDALSENDKILVIDRDPLLVLLNLHSSQSVSDYPIKVPPGTLHGVLNTDESRFGGQNRITATQAYPHHTNTSNNERHTTINIYLPCRTGLILQRT